VLRPGGRLALADIAFADGAGFLIERFEGLRRVGTLAGNRAAWERHLRTVTVQNVNANVRPGAQQTVWRCASSVTYRLGLAELSTWLSLGMYTQALVFGLAAGLLRYDLILLGASSDGARAHGLG
jgi:hypothetical protein